MAKRQRKQKSLQEVFSSFVEHELDEIEKYFGLSGSDLDPHEQRQPTGMLVMDMILGKGIKPGWYTIYGGEQSCKSTASQEILAEVVTLAHGIDVKLYYDYEGSTEPVYFGNILEKKGSRLKSTDVFGVRGEQGWVVPPLVRYYPEQVAEKFFDSIARVLRFLPDKKKIGEKWYQIFEDTKRNRAIISELGKEFDANFLKKNGKLKVEAIS